MKARILTTLAILSFVTFAFAQEPSNTAGSATSKDKDKDIDPLALQVLKAATEPIHQAKSFSFRALVSREQIGTNGQMITLFHLTDVTMQRPDKLHVDFHGRGKEVQLFYDSGQAALYSPDTKFDTTIASPKTIEATLEALQKKDVFIPVWNFLDNDPYQSLTTGLLTGYVIGKVMLFDQPVHQLAFTDPDTEWQLWVVGGDKPVIRRPEVIDKTLPERPCTVVDFLDWNLNANPSKDRFTFKKPADAKEIQLMKDVASE